MTGEYVIKITNGDAGITTFADDNQSDVMADAVNYLIESHDLISEIGPIPLSPARETRY